MLVELLVILVGLIVLWYDEDYRKYYDYPPGPLRLPLLGNLVQLALQPSKLPSTALRGLAKIYGDLILVRMGVVDFVVFSSYDVIMELHQMEGMGNRKMFGYMSDRCEGRNVGLVTSNGERSQNLRCFTIRALREFGFGKSSNDKVINEEAAKFQKHLKSILDSTHDNVINVDNGDLFDCTVLNVMWRLVSGKEYELDDERITKMLRLSKEYISSYRVDDISICYPILRDLFPKMTGRVFQRECVENLKDFLEGVIQQHVDMGSFIDNPNSYIDLFLKKIEEEKESGKTGDESDFNHTTHLYAVLDLFQAGAETTSKMLTFVFLHLVRNPEMQARLHAEIDSVLGNKEELDNGDATTTVSTLMKARFPFTQAVILESIRYNLVVPIPAPYECTKDLHLRGYRIPKGTTLMVNLESVHFQESIWGDPATYRPDRFIKPDGSLNTKLAEYVIGFSKGKRMCFGQTLAEAALFIYLVAILKAFKFEKAPGKPEPSDVPKIGLLYSPQPFWTKITLRN